ncbi:cyclin-D3-2-like [Juglans regia]|uniref:B-like cyclin n=1 Tax=Juglans regia TaxID=51240 RepID=A0A6P9DY63_JUGRE|nr:cyclin-D3-2-like [Juglans regia]
MAEVNLNLIKRGFNLFFSKEYGSARRRNPTAKSPQMVFDGLFCEEESFEEEDGIKEEGRKNVDENVKKYSLFRLVLVVNDMVWDNDELVSLIIKEGETHVCLSSLISNGPSMVARKEVADWTLRVKAHNRFSTLTAFLAVNYFDSFASGLMFQRDKPWMSHLALLFMSLPIRGL